MFGIFGRISKLLSPYSAISPGTLNNILRSPLWAKLFCTAGKCSQPFETQYTVDFVPSCLFSSDFSWRARDTARSQAPIFYFLVSYGGYTRRRRLRLLYRLSWNPCFTRLLNLMLKFPLYSNKAGDIKCLTFISTVLKIHIPTNGEKCLCKLPYY